MSLSCPLCYNLHIILSFPCTLSSSSSSSFLIVVDFQSCLICVARRVPMKERPMLPTHESFTTRQDLQGTHTHWTNTVMICKWDEVELKVPRVTDIFSFYKHKKICGQGRVKVIWCICQNLWYIEVMCFVTNQCIGRINVAEDPLYRQNKNEAIDPVWEVPPIALGESPRGLCWSNCFYKSLSKYSYFSVDLWCQWTLS